jgi:uncharacterized iron-regulated membrane protein
MSISGPLQPQSALYRAVWRWHFLAGLFALPFLLNLAITGSLYLFAPEINRILYRSLEEVPAWAEAPLPSLQYFGFWASCLVEIAAGWAIVLALSGIFLWWPRGRTGGVVTIRATPKYRTFWRDLHAVTGLFVSGIIVFLAVTGMPWSKVWGDYVQEWTTAAGLGRPKPPAEVVPAWKLVGGKSKHEGHVHGGAAPAANLPWALEKAAPPESMPAARPSITIDQALAAFAAMGLEKPYDIAIPQGPKGAFTATSHPARVEETRTVYLDQYSGKVLGDVGFAQYGPAAKAIEWGIAVHQGQEYGPVNRYVMLAGCISIVLLAISAPVMWWKRRPKGSFGLPPAAASKRAVAGVLAVMAIARVLYPLVGLSILGALIVERLYELARRRLAWQARAAQ